MVAKKPRDLTIAEIAKYTGHLHRVDVKIEGTSPALPHRFSEKARKQMLAKQRGRARAQDKSPKVPVQDAIDALYFLSGKPKLTEELREITDDEALQGLDLTQLLGKSKLGVPAVWFKSAMVRAGKALGFVMKDLQCAILVHATHGTRIPIDFEAAIMQCDMARVDNGRTADLRFRTGLHGWSVTLNIEYNSKVVSLEQIIALINDAGKLVGVGDWRNDRSGTYGAFHIVGVRTYDEPKNGKAKKKGKKA